VGGVMILAAGLNHSFVKTSEASTNTFVCDHMIDRQVYDFQAPKLV